MSRQVKADARQRNIEMAASDYRGKVMSVIRNRISDRAEADDILQEVMAEYVENYDLGAAIENLGAWLVRVAQNKILDVFRRRKTQAKHAAEARASGEDGTTPSPDEEFRRSIIREEILAALEDLPPKQRDVFVKHELEGKSFEKIAGETGVPINTLLSRKRYAVLFLRDRLKEIYDELE